jgi:hypothetical protein
MAATPGASAVLVRASAIATRFPTVSAIREDSGLRFWNTSPPQQAPQVWPRTATKSALRRATAGLQSLARATRNARLQGLTIRAAMTKDKKGVCTAGTSGLATLTLCDAADGAVDPETRSAGYGEPRATAVSVLLGLPALYPLPNSATSCRQQVPDANPRLLGHAPVDHQGPRPRGRVRTMARMQRSRCAPRRRRRGRTVESRLRGRGLL